MWSPGPDVVQFWTGFDFKDSTMVNGKQMVVWMVSYINLLQQNPDKVTQSLNRMLDIASQDSLSYAAAAKIVKQYIYDPNSPYRNDEWYIDVLNHTLTSDKLSETDKERLRFVLDMLKRNRVGEKATDFTFTQASGKHANLYDLESKYILIYFYNPGCETCREILEKLKNSGVINRLLLSKLITILAFYPDEDLNEWLSGQKSIPSAWINAYDKHQIVSNKKLYDLKAIPSLYLLDRDKKVILKDAEFPVIEKFLYENNQLFMQ